MLMGQAFTPLPMSRQSSSRDEDDRMEGSSHPQPTNRDFFHPPPSNLLPPPRVLTQFPPPRTVTQQPRVELPPVSEPTIGPPPIESESLSMSEPAPMVEPSQLDVDTNMEDGRDRLFLEEVTPPGWGFGAPTFVAVPGELTPQPPIILDTRAPPSAPKGKGKEREMYAPSDTDYADTDDQRAAAKPAKSLTAKQKRKKKNRDEQQRREHERRVLNDPGRIPDVWGMYRHRTFTERDNSMRYMLSWKVHYSRRTNTVAAGTSAHIQSRMDFTGQPPYPASHAVYTAASHGLPMNPGEVDRLIQLAETPSHQPGLQVEAFILLMELYTIAGRTVPEARDRAMQHILDCGFSTGNDNPVHDIDAESEPWLKIRQPIQQDNRQVFTICQSSATRGAGIPQPAPHDMLHIDHLGQWMILHARPGMPNFINGAVINFQFAIHRRSVFGYGLVRLLSPQDRSSRVHFARRLAIVFASPNLYREAISRYNSKHPTTLFREQTGPSFMIRRAEFPANSVGNISVDNVICALLFNRIPPSWVDHAYLYGLHLMAQSHTGSSCNEDLFRQYDEDHLRRLSEFGVPPPIPEWDGWRYPTSNDYQRLLLLTQLEDEANTEESFFDGRWLLVGESPFFTHLHDSPRRSRQFIAQGSASSNVAPVLTDPASTADPVDTTVPSDHHATTLSNPPPPDVEPQTMDEAPDFTTGGAEPALPVESSSANLEVDAPSVAEAIDPQLPSDTVA